MRASFAIVTFVVLAACQPEAVAPHVGTAIDHGKWLFEHKEASPAASNAYACATCHRATSAKDPAILTGAPLAGVAQRPTFWGGNSPALLDAINLCRFWFMDAQQPWLAQDAAAQAMWAYLASLPADLPQAQTLTVVMTIADVAQGNASKGAAVYAKACQTCHGAIHSGLGRMPAAPELPHMFVADHAKYTPLQRRLTCIEKVRHGPFLGYGGKMPPFGTQVLTDSELADILALLGL